MAEHTPGPWEVRETDDGFEIRMGTSLGDPSGWQVQHMLEMRCGLDPDDEPEQYDEAWATVHVAAAAPLLLEALAAIVDLRFVTDELECSCYESAPCEACQIQSAIHEGASVLAALAAAEPPSEAAHA